MRFKIRTLLAITAISAVCVTCWRIQTVPFLPTIAHYPFDILRDHEMRATTKVNGYNIALVQKPGSDFYETYFEISKDAHQHVSKLMIAPDDAKWRTPNIRRQAGKIYFCDGNTIADATPYIDVKSMTIHYQLVRNTDTIVPFNALTFDGGWDR